MAHCEKNLPVNFSIWQSRHPETHAALAELHKRRLRCAVFSGTLAFWHGVRPYLSRSSDTDLLGHLDDFDEATGVLNATVRRRTFDIKTGHGPNLRYDGDEATVLLDGRLVQLIRPTTPAYYDGTEYCLGLSNIAVRACEEHMGVLATHRADTILVKAIMWRQGNGKRDIQDATGLAAQILPSDAGYIARRAQEIGIMPDSYLGSVISRILPDEVCLQGWRPEPAPQA